jgi:glucose/arabinose dehydrogenase
MKLKLFLAACLSGFAVCAQTITPVEFATGFRDITEITHAGSSRMYVVEQRGLIRMLESDGSIGTNPFIDLRSIVNYGGEQGLLGLAFHPEHVANGYFFVFYNNDAGDLEISRYSRSTATPDVADAESGQILLTIPHPDNTNHNGGCMHFGPDGYLYISTGDGGGAGDPNGNAQNTNVLLGKMLRIDVNSGTTYGIPDTNPFAETDGADEIWATGLRNAWKFSFTRLENTMWIADVGQGRFEEINKIANPASPGLNFGWRCYEGDLESTNSSGCPDGNTTFTFPVAQYDHTGGACSITGGYEYTGNTYPNMQGKYFFADYCNGKIGWVNSENPAAITWTASSDRNFTTFGEDINGELYIAGSNGTIYKVTDATAGTEQFNSTGITVYPNPANNEVFININNQGVPAQIVIFDLGGKRLIQQSINAENNRIDTSSLQAGMYLLEINLSGRRVQHKLIVN